MEARVACMARLHGRGKSLSYPTAWSSCIHLFWISTCSMHKVSDKNKRVSTTTKWRSGSKEERVVIKRCFCHHPFKARSYSDHISLYHNSSAANRGIVELERTLSNISLISSHAGNLDILELERALRCKSQD